MQLSLIDFHLYFPGDKDWVSYIRSPLAWGSEHHTIDLQYLSVEVRIGREKNGRRKEKGKKEAEKEKAREEAGGVGGTVPRTV